MASRQGDPAYRNDHACYTIFRHTPIGFRRQRPMQQDWNYYLALAAGAAILALFYRARRRGGGPNAAVVFAVVVVVGLLLAFSAALT